MAQPPPPPENRDDASSSYFASYALEHGDHDHDGETGAEEDKASYTSWWSAKAHRSAKVKSKTDEEKMPWRLRSRLKTFNAGLFICLNIGVDPPDIVKTNPAAKLECWLDPTALPATKAIEAIGRNLSQQFETLNPKVKYKCHLDPSVEETKKQCVLLRKAARDERTMFYYNGHGVPKPTPSGEIWVFNKNYTQYIPVGLYDLQDWLGSPCIYIWECSGAGNILTNFVKAAERKDSEARQAAQSGTPGHPISDMPGSSYSDAIHLAACKANEILPMTPTLPADVFTCCLTSPIEIALRHFVLQDPLKRNAMAAGDARSKVNVDMVMRIPGDLKDRRTPLGELSWIFTAVTDTIAWLSFPRDTFNRLFRQDLLVAALFRNFLLAQRIMTTYHCTPQSIPELPSTHNHPLWDSWDLAVDACINQLPDLLEREASRDENVPASQVLSHYKPSTFFTQHLQAFEIWLAHGGVVPRQLSIPTKRSYATATRSPPEQLPIILQVLLSQAHRLRALILLSRFVDFGPWAVHLSLSIGIFPYVQKLLQSPAVELKPVLIFIWTRILAVDRTAQVDLLRDNGFNYFAQVLTPFTSSSILIPNNTEHRAMCAFILSVQCRGFKQGQSACLAANVLDMCVARLQEDDWLTKVWCLLCIAQMWADNDEAKASFISSERQNQLVAILRDASTDVRAAALYAFGVLLGASAAPIDSAESRGRGGMGAQIGISELAQLELEAGLAYACMVTVKEDASPMVRKELVVVISCVVREWRGWMVCAAFVYYEQEAYNAAMERDAEPPVDVVGPALEAWASDERRSQEEAQHVLTVLGSFKTIFETLLDLSVDPHTEVAVMASTVADYVIALLLDSAFTRVPGSALAKENQQQSKHRPPTLLRQASTAYSESTRSSPSTANGTIPTPLTRTNTDSSSRSTFSGIKRSSSVANALRNFASMTGLVNTTEEEPPRVRTPISGSFTALNELAPDSTQYHSPYPDASHSRILPEGSELALSRGGSQTSSRARTGLAMTAQIQSRTQATSAAAIFEAMTEEDMERLRIRRLQGTQAGGEHDGRGSNNGLARASDLGLGMVAKEVKDDVLPLKSGFYDWSLEYYREPQMQAPEAEDTGSQSFNAQAWKRARNTELSLRSQANQTYAATNSWDADAGTLHNDAWPLQLAFHAYDTVMAVTDDADNICVWDWKYRTKLNKFSNQNVNKSSISSVTFINEMATSLMLTASTEGSIRIWRGYDEPGQTELASTFRGVSELFPVAHSSGVLTSWNQSRGHLLVGGDMKVIRLWDAGVERHLRDIPTQAGANVTALAAEQEDGNVFVAGFGDGVVRLFDKRCEESSSAVVRTWRNHKTWIQSVHMQWSGLRDLVTGSLNGEVRIWDVRNAAAPLYEKKAIPSGLAALAVHPGSPVLAMTSAPTSHSTRQRLILQGFTNPTRPIPLSELMIPLTPNYTTPQRPIGFLPSASSLVFHPTEMMVAAGGFDTSGTVKLFKCNTPDLEIIEDEEDSEQPNGHEADSDSEYSYKPPNGHRRH